ncbi:hypothetical protein [Streptomyces decoyicus]|uniref:hypothetical protein n=1 Tax=Streptomyces decoyicus TaxID=249567 RepID=UPI00381C42B5
MCPPAPAPLPFALPAALQPPVSGTPPVGSVTVCAVAYGDSSTAYVTTSVPGAGPVAASPARPAARRSWRTAVAVAAAVFVAAVGCGVVALDYPSLERVWQVAGGFSTVAGAVVAVVTLIGRRNGAGARQ